MLSRSLYSDKSSKNSLPKAAYKYIEGLVLEQTEPGGHAFVEQSCWWRKFAKDLRSVNRWCSSINSINSMLNAKLFPLQ